tara:strand:+ start:443 stop:862 length:420 start_codon:yes stop_codon:yes gene_type:complete
MSKRCSVYIVGYEHPRFGNVVKVGLSEAVASRIGQLQTASVDALILHLEVSLPDRGTAKFVERKFHQTFEDVCIRGEWFGMNPGRAMFMLGNMVNSEVFAGALGPAPEAFEAFHTVDRETQTDWVNDWCEREEAAFECL